MEAFDELSFGSCGRSVWELALRSRLSANLKDQILSERKDANGPSLVHPNSLVGESTDCHRVLFNSRFVETTD